MSFEDTEHDPFGGDPSPWSKMYFLKIAVECGAAFTGYCEIVDRRTYGTYIMHVECPYHGAHRHAEDLMAERLLTKEPFEGLADCTIWVPTEAGKIVGRSLP